MNDKTMDMIFNLKFTSKQLERLAKKAEKEQKSQTAKVKKAIADKNVDTARIYAENAIRKKNESLTHLRMAARVDAVASKVQSAYTMKDVTKMMGGVVKSLEKAMKSMNLEEVDKIMQKVETQFEELDVRTTTMEESLGTATTLTTPEDAVMGLIKQVAEENDLEITDQLVGLNPGADSLRSEASAAPADKEDQLARRLAQLRS